MLNSTNSGASPPKTFRYAAASTEVALAVRSLRGGRYRSFRWSSVAVVRLLHHRVPPTITITIHMHHSAARNSCLAVGASWGQLLGPRGNTVQIRKSTSPRPAVISVRTPGLSRHCRDIRWDPRARECGNVRPGHPGRRHCHAVATSWRSAPALVIALIVIAG
jgi:hypothetical protein